MNSKIVFDNRLVLYLVMTASFMLWLAFFAGFIFYVLNHLDTLDPAMALFSGLGLGTVTGFFTAMLTLGWQFYFRKKETTPAPVQPVAGAPMEGAKVS